MKSMPSHLLRCAAIVAVLPLVGPSGLHGHGDDKDHKHAHGHPHGDHKHDHHHHATIVVGPNGGRVLEGVKPPVEFVVTKDRKVKLVFLDEKLKPVPVAKQTAVIFAGDRSAPTRLQFRKAWGRLVSEGKLPEGNGFPTVIQIKASPDAAPMLAKFNLDLSECATCDSLEYACACDHSH